MVLLRRVNGPVSNAPRLSAFLAVKRDHFTGKTESATTTHNRMQPIHSGAFPSALAMKATRAPTRKRTVMLRSAMSVSSAGFGDLIHQALPLGGVFGIDDFPFFPRELVATFGLRLRDE